MRRRFYILAVVMFLLPVLAGAQALKGSYFLENSLNRNKLNPAFTPDVNYVQLPAIGNFGAGVYSNMGVDTFMYPIDGQLYTFLNKNVGTAQFDAALAKNPYLDAAVDANIVSYGRKSKKAYWTVDVSLNVREDMDMPRDMFMFMKFGNLNPATYDLGEVRGHASASMQAAVGYSRSLYDLVPGLKVGAKVRAILPVVYLDFNMANKLTTSDEKWMVNSELKLNEALKGAQIVESDETTVSLTIPSPCGFGFSADFGVEYKLEFDGFINGLNFSAAVTDLGAIYYDKNTFRSYGSTADMDWTGVKVSLENGEVITSADDIAGELEKLMELKRISGTAEASKSTLPSFYVGAELPFLNNKMSLGALYSGRKSYNYTRNELTVSYNMNPTKWFAASVSYSFLNTFKTIGWLLEFTPKVGPCFYIGSDYFCLQTARLPESLDGVIIPMSARFNLRVGLAVSLGRK